MRNFCSISCLHKIYVCLFLFFVFFNKCIDEFRDGSLLLASPVNGDHFFFFLCFHFSLTDITSLFLALVNTVYYIQTVTNCSIAKVRVYLQVTYQTLKMKLQYPIAVTSHLIDSKLTLANLVLD